MKYPEIKHIAGQLRKRPTRSEKILWTFLRIKQLGGYRFLRQHPVYYERKENDHFFFIPDFYCPKLKLMIELDGGIHINLEEKDIIRDEILMSKGFKIIRIANDELSDIERVKIKILEYINTNY